MLKGCLESRGFSISERHLRAALPQIAPTQHIQRQAGQVDRTNPRLYDANYFGEKLHIDQNEKLNMYGVTYVLARDGYSGKIMAGAVMPRKNNITIYNQVFRSTILEYGLWDQIRVDNGNEFYLTLFIQEKLRENRGNLLVAPYRQTTSRENHVIERIWVELNHRVSYPLKRAMSHMVNEEMIDMESDIVKFCISTVLMKFCEIGMRHFIEAWNFHHLSSRGGTPNFLQSHRFGATPLHHSEIPTAQDAATQYRQQGGTLADPSAYGHDPLEQNTALANRRETLFLECVPASLPDIFGHLLVNNTVHFEETILHYISITEELSP